MMETKKDVLKKLLPQPEFISITFAYNQQLKAYAAFEVIDPFIKQFIEPEMIENVLCECGCGRHHVCVSKENIDLVIEKLKVRRAEDLN